MHSCLNEWKIFCCKIWNLLYNMKCWLYFKKVGEICKASKKRCDVNICCQQKARWKSQEARMIGNAFKFLWNRSSKTKDGVCVVVANWLVEKVVGVERFRNRVMKVNAVSLDAVWEVSWYWPDWEICNLERRTLWTHAQSCYKWKGDCRRLELCWLWCS